MYIIEKFFGKQTLLRLSDVIEAQKKAMDIVLEANTKGIFPDDNPVWKRPDWINPDTEDEDELEEIARNEEFLNEQNELANCRFRLNDVKIDINMVMLGINNNGSQAQYMGVSPTTHFVLMGEIVQMPGHVVVTAMVGPDHGKTLVGFHDDNFYILPPGET